MYTHAHAQTSLLRSIVVGLKTHMNAGVQSLHVNRGLVSAMSRIGSQCAGEPPHDKDGTICSDSWSRGVVLVAMPSLVIVKVIKGVLVKRHEREEPFGLSPSGFSSFIYFLSTFGRPSLTCLNTKWPKTRLAPLGSHPHLSKFCGYLCIFLSVDAGNKALVFRPCPLLDPLPPAPVF